MKNEVVGMDEKAFMLSDINLFTTQRALEAYNHMREQIEIAHVRCDKTLKLVYPIDEYGKYKSEHMAAKLDIEKNMILMKKQALVAAQTMDMAAIKLYDNHVRSMMEMIGHTRPDICDGCDGCDDDDGDDYLDS
jgi:hypothetical protein